MEKAEIISNRSILLNTDIFSEEYEDEDYAVQEEACEDGEETSDSISSEQTDDGETPDDDNSEEDVFSAGLFDMDMPIIPDVWSPCDENRKHKYKQNLFDFYENLNFSSEKSQSVKRSSNSKRSNRFRREKKDDFSLSNNKRSSFEILDRTIPLKHKNNSHEGISTSNVKGTKKQKKSELSKISQSHNTQKVRTKKGSHRFENMKLERYESSDLPLSCESESILIHKRNNYEKNESLEYEKLSEIKNKWKLRGMEMSYGSEDGKQHGKMKLKLKMRSK